MLGQDTCPPSVCRIVPKVTVTAVAFDAAAGAVTGKPVSFHEVEVTISPDNGAANFGNSNTDVAPDGRFLRSRFTTPNLDGATNVSLILNWLDVLRLPVP